MAKHADGPPSGRMGFGYLEAKEAGLGGWCKEKSVEDFNDTARKKAAERTALKERLETLQKDYPPFEVEAKKLHSIGLNSLSIVTQLEERAQRNRQRQQETNRRKKALEESRK